MAKHFSFLLGAGFSKPAGYPLATEINNKFRSLTHKDFMIHSSQSANLIQRGKEQNWLIEKYRYMFVEEFIKFYNEKIITPKEFNYEYFFDYYNDLNRREELSPDEKFFFDEFGKKYDYPLDHHSLLFDFNRTYEQLVAHFITVEWPISASILKLYPKHEHAEFLYLLEYLAEKYRVHIHSLNHDLLMEKYFHTQTLGNKISDGFDDSYSPYFANVTLTTNKNGNINPYTHDIRLRRFKNKYDSTFNLYKLHGSVDNYVFNLNNKKYDMIKWAYGINEGSVYKEITTHYGEIKKENFYMDVIPEFLSGTTEKLRHYERTVYYSQIFEHFFHNLINSKHLIVIGYGFKDSKINEYLKTYFSNDSQKIMLVIDISKPQSELLNQSNVKFIEQSVIDLDIARVKTILNI